jgi:uncharacterized protein YjbJ (UPF0337 family)
MGEITDKIKGTLEQAADILGRDKKLEREGRVEEAKGRAKGAVERRSRMPWTRGRVEEAKGRAKGAVERRSRMPWTK